MRERAHDRAASVGGRDGRLGAVAGVVAGHPGAVAAGGLAPLLAGVVREEVADAAGGRAGPQAVAVGAVEEGDRRTGEGGGEPVGGCGGAGDAVARDGRAVLRPVEPRRDRGGRPARNAAIQAGHGRSAAQLRAALGDALDEVEASWSAVGPDDWQRPVRFRDGVLLDAGFAWWRELEIHTADALLGPGVSDWSRPFCGHVVEYLASRVPAGVRLTLTATDSPWTSTCGTGRTVAVSGALPDLAAWLAGRRPAGPLTGDPLPPLGPWP
jgi:maleylpyruvate isomerase